MIISIDKQKVFNTIQHTFMIKALMKVKIEDNFLNTVKDILENPQLTLYTVVKVWKRFPLWSGARQNCPLSPSSTKSLSQRNATRKRNKGIQIGKEQVKLLIDDIIFYIVSHKESTQKRFELMNDFSSVTGFHTNIQVRCISMFQEWTILKDKVRKQFHL